MLPGLPHAAPSHLVPPMPLRQVLDKLRRSLEAGQHYEAQQMLQTVYYRYRARKQLEEAYQLLQVL